MIAMMKLGMRSDFTTSPKLHVIFIIIIIIIVINM